MSEGRGREWGRGGGLRVWAVAGLWRERGLLHHARHTCSHTHTHPTPPHPAQIPAGRQRHVRAWHLRGTPGQRGRQPADCCAAGPASRAGRAGRPAPCLSRSLLPLQGMIVSRNGRGVQHLLLALALAVAAEMDEVWGVRVVCVFVVGGDGGGVCVCLVSVCGGGDTENPAVPGGHGAVHPSAGLRRAAAAPPPTTLWPPLTPPCRRSLALPCRSLLWSSCCPAAGGWAG